MEWKKCQKKVSHESLSRKFLSLLSTTPIISGPLTSVLSPRAPPPSSVIRLINTAGRLFIRTIYYDEFHWHYLERGWKLIKLMTEWLTCSSSYSIKRCFSQIKQFNLYSSMFSISLFWATRKGKISWWEKIRNWKNFKTRKFPSGQITILEQKPIVL